MDPSYEELLKQLKEEKLLRVEAEKSAIAEKQRANAEKQRANEQAERAAKLQEKRRPTTLIEYIQLCHDHLSTKFRVQTNRRLTTQGTWTNPAGKYCPRRLAPWDGFLDEQRAALGKVIAFLPETLELFESHDLVQGTGSRLAVGSPIGSERDLELFHHSAVELPVQFIIDQLVRAQKGSDAIPPLADMGDGVFFENHMNVLNSDTTPSPSPAPSTPPPPHVRAAKKVLIQPDQICIYRSLNGDRTLAYVLEYKAPHKLTAHQVREGISPLDVVRDVVNCAEIPNDDGEHFRYFAKRLSAAAATQVYHYMLQTGLKMGLVATGEVIIFFKIDWTDPSTLYYHVAEPTPECRDQPASYLPYCTAVSQLLAFTVMALLGPTPQGQDARDRATASAPIWKENWDEILAQVEKTPAARILPSSGSCWAPRTYVGYDRSPIPFRHPRRPKSPQVEKPPPFLGWRQDLSDDDDDDDDAGHNNPGYRLSSTGGARSKRKRDAAQPSGAGAAAAAPGDTQTQNRTHSSQPQTPPFCTHACLLGLARGGALDPACPNVALHRRPHVKSSPCVQSSSSLPRDCRKTHPLPLDAFLERLRRQLHTTLDKGIVPLGRHGARGALFRITLLSHGYTFAAKGTTSSSVRFIEHEARVYEQLQPIQGLYVPVSLGTIDLGQLGRRYFYAADVHIVYFLLLSWAGRDLFEAREQTGDVGMQENVLHSLRSLHALGVAHGDVRRENLVWSHIPSDPVMIIDFERSVFTKASCRLGLLGGSEDGDKKLFEQDRKMATGIF
ncbi:hypothetical protein B0T25DRAFT_529692 [Lasiosphaeria hispida]|uniref:Protein kinase domain-containing protein n=1 Tax=Lasiosphaeria hispida TaxID=260671 RepID=A0AAJ0ML01_9PEZI|nr:hypothetical protein B0T25DRAFT_529692 [Lasiosphaeria hispida]